MGEGAESLFFIFPDYTEIGDGWLKFIYIYANHMYLVNREYLYIIPMYYEKKTNVVCNNQNSLERATIELSNTHFFSVSLRTLLDKIKVINLFCSVWFFLSVKCSLFCINVFYLSDTVHKQHIFFFISQQLPGFLPTGKRHRFIKRPWIKYIVGVEKIFGIASFKSIPVVYYSLIGNDFHDHKRYFQCVCIWIRKWK